MIKKIVVIALIIVVLAGVGVGIYDTYQGNSALRLSSLNPLQSSLAWAQGQGRGQGQGQGQWAGPEQGRGQGRGQGQGQGWGQGQGQPGQSNAGATLVQHEWLTVKGTAVTFDQQQGLVVDTVEQGQLTLPLGPVGFAGQQEVAFNPSDSVTIQGFAGEQGTFVAGQITNGATGATLLLRDPNGRPLWAGRGQGGQP